MFLGWSDWDWALNELFLWFWWWNMDVDVLLNNSCLSTEA
jgi:hypothetical protein